ncbi:heme peroxidase [Rhizoclosmatium hyalinum]|nr:heme peroxidase [Rhizoclosmatium hyalinum]
MRLFIAVFLVAASSVFSCPYASSNSDSRAANVASPHFKRSPGWSSSYTPSMSDVDWATLRANVAAQVAKGLGPKMIRAGFADAASYNSKTGTGGPHAQSLLLAKNADALQFVRSLKTGISGYISNADVISFAAAAAVSAASNRTVPWRPGRADALNATDAAFPASDGQTVPLWNAADVRTWFARLGFASDRDAVVLMGSHTLGNCHLQVSGYAGPWTTTPLLLTNEFYTRLVTASSTPSLYSNVSVTFNGTTKWQWADNRGRMMLPVDMNMIRDPTYFSLIKEYAANNDKFMDDFVDAYGRLLELGVASILLNPVDSSLSRKQTTIDKPESASTCYPQASNPIVCFSSQSDNKGSTIFTVHSIKPGWVAFGVGSNSMDNADVIIGWPNSQKDVSTQALTTFRHGITLNSKPAWQQIKLAEPAPSWAAISFSAVHLNTIAPETGLVGRDIGSSFIFAVSSYPPTNPDVVPTASSFYQHEISGVFGDTAATDGNGNVAGGVESNSGEVVQPIAQQVPPSHPKEEQVLEIKLLTKKPWEYDAEQASVGGTSSVDRTLTSPQPLYEKLRTTAGESDFMVSHRPEAEILPNKGPNVFRALTDVSAGGQHPGTMPAPSSASATDLKFMSEVEKLCALGADALKNDPLEWGIIEVAAWLTRNGGSELSTRIVRDQKITGRVLMLTRISDLCSVLGIEKFGDRVLFEEGVLQLKQRKGASSGAVGDEPPLYLG